MADTACTAPGRRAMLPAIALCLALAPAAMSSEAQDETAPDAEALKRLVHQDCGSCHGLTLKGGLGPDIRPGSLEHYSVDVLRGVILDGIPETAMPPWRPLMTPQEADWVARYLLNPEQTQ